MKTALKSIALVLAGAGLAAFLFANPFDWAALSPLQRLGGGGATAAGDAEAGAGLYTCGMHPQVLNEGPGTCPICQMDLTPLGESEDGAPAQAAGEKWVCPKHSETIREDEAGECPICGRELVLEDHDHEAHSEGQGWWTCPMHPQIVEEEAGSCPICGMDLVWKEEAAPQSARSGGRGAVVTIDPGVIQNMNVRTTRAEQGDVVRQLRTIGSFAYDQDRMVTVTTKFEGWIEKAHVSYVGEKVRRGHPLFEIYSRELVQTQQELLSARGYAERLADAESGARERAEALVAAARQRLRYWDITQDQIRRIEESGELRRTLTINAPTSGIVMRRPSGLEGMAVRPGMEVLHLAAVDTLWLETEVYEDQLSWIGVDTPAQITVDAYPGLELTGRVKFVDPAVAETTRTIAVTLEIPNPDELLKVGMWANVRFETALARDVVLVPSQAVLRTGERDVVVVALGGGRFEPRNVQLGAEGDGRVAVRSGLEAGTEIVTSAQFLIDSESNLREAVQKMIAERRRKD